jgi:hypothetical protein
MKKLLSTLCVAAILCTLAACSEGGNVTPGGENPHETPALTTGTTAAFATGTTAAPQTTLTPETTEAIVIVQPNDSVATTPVTLSTSLIVTTPSVPTEGGCRNNNHFCCGSGYWGYLWAEGPLHTVFCSVNAFNAFLQNNENSLPSLFVPRVPVPGFELATINYTGVSSVTTSWKSPCGAVITYHSWFATSATDAREHLTRFTMNDSSVFSGTGGREIHHRILDSSHAFDFIDGNIHTTVYFENFSDMSVADMARHLDLVPVSGAATS